MRGRRVVAVAGIAGVLLLAGCSADRSSSSSGAAAKGAPAMAANGGQAAPRSLGGTPATPAPGAAAASGAPGAPGGAVVPPATDGRNIAYTAQLTVEVHQVQTAAATARAATEAAGGYVASETVSGEQKGPDGDPYEDRLTLKVPSADHQQSLDRLSALGRPLALSSQAEDVTQQVVDVDSRLKTQQASVDRVRGLMAEAKSLSEVVSLESELSRREADLESLQQQQRALAARTSMSTITLDLVHADQPAPPPPAKHDGFWSSVGHALSGGWHVLLSVAKGLLIALAAAAPFLALLAPLAWYLLRRRRTRAVAGEPPTE